MKIFINFIVFAFCYNILFLIFGAIAYMWDLKLLSEIIFWINGHPLPIYKITKNFYFYYFLQTLQWYLIYIVLKRLFFNFFFNDNSSS